MSATPLPSPFSAIVFRGGDVQFVPTEKVDAILDARKNGEMVALHLHTGDVVIDTVCIERIQTFHVWRDAAMVKLASIRKYACEFGQIHDQAELCRCHQQQRLPLTDKAARLLLKKITRYAALPEQEKQEYDASYGYWLRKLVDSEYPKAIGNAHKIPVSLSAPTHDAK